MDYTPLLYARLLNEGKVADIAISGRSNLPKCKNCKLNHHYSQDFSILCTPCPGVPAHKFYGLKGKKVEQGTFREYNRGNNATITTAPPATIRSDVPLI